MREVSQSCALSNCKPRSPSSSAQAADSLHADVAAGQEVPFELASQSGRGRGARLCIAIAR